MKTLKLTAEHFDSNGNYIGTVDVSTHDGDIEIAANLGWTKFKSIWVSGCLIALAGSSIEAGGSIEAGESIEAGGSIEAGLGIEAGLSITCTSMLFSKLRIFAGVCLWKLPSDDENTIRCGKVEAHSVHCKTIIETGLPEDQTDACIDKLTTGESL